VKHLQRDLDRLKRQILTMGSLVETAANKSITAFLDRETDLAAEVLAGDNRIDETEVEVEEDCLKILALHQPFAGDLRFIITVLKVNNDLERMGDLAVNIAERAEALAHQPRLEIPIDLDDMADRVRRMVREALDSLVGQDVKLARKVLKDDQDVDAIHRKMYDVLQSVMTSDPAKIDRAIQTLSVSRNLERIADLATNIVEDVVFLVEGEVIRHGFNRRY
jgi:phosphate transport system protein